MADKTLTVRLHADFTSLRAGLAAASADVKKFGHDINDAANNANAGTRKLASGMLVAGGVIAAGFAAASVAAIKFEQDLTNVTTISPYVRKNFDQVGDSLIEMSNELPQSSSELAKGLYDIASSGFAGAEGLKVLEVSAKAASAGLSTTATAGRAITGVLNAYGYEADSARQVSDVLFQTVNLGVISFEELAQNIGDVVGVVAAAHVNIEDLGTAVATITLAGVPAAEATTSLNRVIQSLLDPSDALAANLKTLGFDSGEAALNVLGLQGVLEAVTNSTDGTATAMLELFPEIRAARGVLALMANDGENYNRVAKEMGNATKGAGATARALAQQQKSLGYQLEITKNQLVNIGIEIGRALLPYLKIATGFFQDVLGVLRALPGPVQTIIVGMIALAGATLLAGGAFFKFQEASTKAMTGLSSMGKGGEAVAGAMGKIGPALGKLAMGGAIVGASMQLVGKESELAGVGILGMAAGGAMMGSVFGPVGTVIGGATGFIAGMTMELTNSGPAVKEYREQFSKLGTELEGLGRKKALEGFVDKLGDTDAIRAFSGDAKALSNEITALGKTSPPAARQVVKALQDLKDESGKPLYDAKDIGILEHALAKGEEGFRKFAARKKDASKDKLDLTETVDPLKDVEDAANEAADALKKYKDNLDKAFGAPMGAEEANIAFEDSLQSLGETLAENGGTLDLYTEKGRNNRKAILESISAAKDHAVAVYEDTGSISQANSTLETHIKTLADTAHQYGLNDEEVLTYIEDMLGIPPEARTEIKNTADLARVAMQLTIDKYNEANGLVVTTYVKLEGVDLTMQQIANVRQQLSTIPGNYNPTAPGAGAHTGEARGDIVMAARGYIAPRIARAGSGVIYNEVQAGGESYIPWNPAVRARAVGILGQTASAFGYGLTSGGGGGGGPVNVTTNVVIAGNGDTYLRDQFQQHADDRDRKLAQMLRSNR